MKKVSSLYLPCFDPSSIRGMLKVNFAHVNVLHLDDISPATQASNTVKQENNVIYGGNDWKFTLTMKISMTLLHDQAHILEMRCEYGTYGLL